MQWKCKLCEKAFSNCTTVKYHILRVHDGKGNMDGKLQSAIPSNYFDGRDVIINTKLTNPNEFPTDGKVWEAIKQEAESSNQILPE